MPGRCLVFVVATVAAFAQVAWCEAAVSTLDKFLKTRHDLLTIPMAEVGQKVQVRVGLIVLQIIELNEQSEVFRAQLYLKIEWNDYRLKWNVSDFSGLKMTHIHSSQMWIPDIYLNNNARRQTLVDKSPESLIVRIQNDGSCAWWPMFLYSESRCPIDVTWFPFDEQICEINYESYTLSTNHMNMTALSHTAVRSQEYKDTGEWELLDVPVKESLSVYECCEAPFSRVSFAFHLRRKPRYYVINLIVPCCLFSFMAAATFILQPSCSERLGLSVTILLALSVYQIIVNEKLPASSDEVPVLGTYFFFVIVLCVSSAVTTALVMHLHHRAESVTASSMAPWLKVILCKRLASYLRMKPTKSKPKMPPRIDLTENQALKGPDRLLESENRIEQPEKFRANNDFNNTDLLLTRICDMIETRLRSVAEKREEEEVNEEIKSDWMLAAAVIDRILFITFTVLFIGGTVVFFMAFW